MTKLDTTYAFRAFMDCLRGVGIHAMRNSFHGVDTICVLKVAAQNYDHGGLTYDTITHGAQVTAGIEF
jgi:hypothetical protein